MIEAAEHVEQRRLSGTRRALDSDDLTLADRERDVVEGSHVVAAHLINPGDFLRCQYRGHSCFELTLHNSKRSSSKPFSAMSNSTADKPCDSIKFRTLASSCTAPEIITSEPVDSPSSRAAMLTVEPK